MIRGTLEGYKVAATLYISLNSFQLGFDKVIGGVDLPSDLVSARVGIHIRSCADRALDGTSLLAPRLIVRSHGVLANIMSTHCRVLQKMVFARRKKKGWEGKKV